MEFLLPTWSFVTLGSLSLTRAMSKIGVQDLTVSGHLMSQLLVLSDASSGLLSSLHSLACLDFVIFMHHSVSFEPVTSARNFYRLGTSFSCGCLNLDSMLLLLGVPSLEAFLSLQSFAQLGTFSFCCGCDFCSTLPLQHFSWMESCVLLSGSTRAP